MDRSDKTWVTASAIRNYMNRDPICDWLDFRKDLFSPETNPALEKIMEKGKEYEDQFVCFLKTKYGSENIKTVATSTADLYDIEKFRETKLYMSQNVPIIYQGVVLNFDKKMGGICDLLIHSDFFNRIISDNEGIFFINEKRGHYVVVDIKCSKLSLAKDGLHLQNGRNYTFYKGQLYIYTEALKSMQNMDSNCAYVLGKGWEFTKEGQKIVGSNALQRMARVDFSFEDNFIISRVEEAINWVRRVRNEGQDWELYPPSIPELRPNLKVDSVRWQKLKKEIGEKQEDITLLYRCGDTKRAMADYQDINSWKRVRSDHLCIKSEKIKKSIDRSIMLNQEENFSILPQKFSTYNLKRYDLELYLDFETFYHQQTNEDVRDILPGKTITYLIGCGFVRNNTWTFKKYVLNSLSEEAQKSLFERLLLDINRDEDFQIYSWGPTEKNLYEKCTSDYTLFSSEKYTDLLKVMRDESVAMTGLHGYSLKNMAKAMKRSGCISSFWDEDNSVKSGMDAMLEGEQLYTSLNERQREEKMRAVIEYNEIDCKVMWEMVTYFRQNHV